MEFSNNRPIYLQIADYIFGCILSGQWPQGERIPSVREMAATLAVNTHTIMKAFDYLQAQAVISPRRGMGYWLADNAKEKVSQLRRQEFFDITLRQLHNEIHLLGISPDEVADYLKSL